MNKAGGYISLHRQIQSWEWYKNPNTAFLFIHLLLSANFTDTRFMGKKIRRGQVVTSLPSLANETGLSIQNVRTALKHLISTGEITDDSCRTYRIITVVKYNEYQTVTDKLTDNQQTTNRQLTDDQQHHNNDNNVNKGIKRSSRDFQPPSLDEVKKYVKEINGVIDPERFFDYYEVRDWCLKDGRKMSNWKAEIRSWERREKNGSGKAGGNDQKQDRSVLDRLNARIPML